VGAVIIDRRSSRPVEMEMEEGRLRRQQHRHHQGCRGDEAGMRCRTLKGNAPRSVGALPDVKMHSGGDSWPRYPRPWLTATQQVNFHLWVHVSARVGVPLVLLASLTAFVAGDKSSSTAITACVCASRIPEGLTTDRGSAAPQ